MAYPRPQVFVDSNVLLAYLRGRSATHALFAEPIASRFDFVTDAVAVQELLLAANQSGIDANALRHLWNSVTVHDVDPAAVWSYADRFRNLRNLYAHSNDLLHLWSARDCTFLVTYDKALAEIARREAINALTPEELLDQVDSTQ